MNRMGDVTGAVILGTAFLVLLGIAEAWSRLGNARPEHSRKLVHFGGGLLCLFFPWLIGSPLVVLALTAGNAALFATGRRLGFLHSLHSVNRRTLGSEFYPISIFLVFLIAHDRPWLYLSAILVLAVADAFAALVGNRYGSIHYEVEDNRKSLEGSLVFLVVAFLAIQLPLLHMTDTPRLVCTLAALYTAILVTGFEAISLGGTDNLFIPIGVAFVLPRILGKPVEGILYQTGSLIGICLVIGLLCRAVASFNPGGSIGIMLFAYGAWSLGSESWALPILTGFAAYMILLFRFRLPGGRRTNVRVRVMFQALLPSVLLVFARSLFDVEPILFGPFLASLIAVLVFAFWNHLMWWVKPLTGMARPAGVVGVTVSVWAVVVVPVWLVHAHVPWIVAVAPGLLVLPFAWINDRLMGSGPEFDTSTRWTLLRSVWVLLIIAVMMVLQHYELLPVWNLAS